MSETGRLWRTWPLAFEEAGKCAPEPRVTYDLPPGQFGLALRSLDHDHAGLASGDSRYQAACALGHLTWYDERGRCVVLVRHGSLVSQYRADGTTKAPPTLAPAPRAETPGDALALKALADAGARRVWFDPAGREHSGAPEFVGPPAPPPGAPGLPPETGKATFAGTVKALMPKGKKK